MHSPTLFCISLVFSCFALGTIITTETSTGIEYEITVEQFQKTKVEIDGKAFIKTTLGGISPFEGIIQEEGRPEVPVIRLYADGDGDILVTPSVRVVPSTRSVLPVLLSGKSIAKRRGQRREIPVLAGPSFDEVKRTSNEFEVRLVGSRRGVKRRLISLYPVQWHHETGVETQVRHFKVVVPKPPAIPNHPRAFGVIVPERFSQHPAFKRWVAFKKQDAGELLIHVTVNETAESIRNVIQTWYKAAPGLEYVLLLGDVDTIPAFSTSKIDGMTDHYFAALDTDYISDLMSPDVTVGRLPIHTTSELVEILGRFETYVSLDTAKNAWFKKNSLIATNDSDFWKVTEEGLIELVTKHFAPLNYFGSFPAKSLLGGDRLFAISHKAVAQDLRSALSEGRGIVLYSGHGEPEGWENPELKGGDVPGLDLAGSMPFVFALSCQTARFTKNSIAEAWVERGAGAVSSVGSYADTYWDEDFVLQRSLFEAVVEKRLPIGKALERGLEEVWRYFGGKNFSDYYWETYHVFSDPSLMLRG